MEHRWLRDQLKQLAKQWGWSLFARAHQPAPTPVKDALKHHSVVVALDVPTWVLSLITSVGMNLRNVMLLTRCLCTCVLGVGENWA